MHRIIVKNAQIVNEGKIIEGDIAWNDGIIEKIDQTIDLSGTEIDGTGLLVFPGIIDDQVHFREPGMPHKADIQSESKAAVAGGVTSFMEMPNTKPTATTQELLEEKYLRASQVSPANYSFFMGATNDNLEEVLKTNHNNVCGVKVFMGSSTGNMLVDASTTLEGIFSKVDMLIATHCEDEATIRRNTALFKTLYGDSIPFNYHPIIRSELACYKSSHLAVELAKKHNTRLHILHISTADELDLFESGPIHSKRITSEVCVHHLHFDARQYETLGSRIKCNPAIKAPHHKMALMEALLNDKLDIIATDHAPHTWEEKSGDYMHAPSGLPLIQHSLDIMMDFVRSGKISIERVIEKMCHAPAECFQIKNRGYLREGYAADIVLYDPNATYTIKKSNILYRCGWSPLEGKTFNGRVQETFVNGVSVYKNGQVSSITPGQRLLFNRS